jgi:hypothetical protein
MGRVTVGVWVVLAASGVGACRERAQAVQSEASVRVMVQQLRRQAEIATGLRYKHDVAVLLRSRDRVRDYVVHKFDEDLPPAELTGASAAYKLFGLIPDSLDLRQTMIDLLTEQVAGYYDPDSGALFIPTDLDDPFRMRLVISHELIHALQDQYMSLDSIINVRRRNDRRSAAQAILEGQATFYQIPMMMPEQRPETLPPHWFWRQRAAMAQQQAQMPEFSGAPLWLRETLIFPYLAGADFIGWFTRAHPNQEPFGAAMPVSTEQILHPERYAAGDQPVRLAFTAGGPGADTVRYEDGLGEFEIGLLFTELLHDSSEARGPAYAMDWGGDRFRVYGAAADALVWYSVWDDAAARDRFARGLRRVWTARRGTERTRRFQIDTLTIGDHPGARLVDAPVDWNGWGAVPSVRIIP